MLLNARLQIHFSHISHIKCETIEIAFLMDVSGYLCGNLKCLF